MPSTAAIIDLLPPRGVPQPVLVLLKRLVGADNVGFACSGNNPQTRLRQTATHSSSRIFAGSIPVGENSRLISN